MPQSTSGKARVLLPLTLMVLAAACDNLLEPPVHVQPMLEDLVVHTSTTPTGGVLRINAVPQDFRFSPAENERISVLLRTPGGETHTLLLRPAICWGRDGMEHRCDRFIIGMQDGTDVRQLAPLAAALPGRVVLSRVLDSEGNVVYSSHSYASVVIFGGDLQRAMAAAGRWPHVRFVELSGILRPAVPTAESYRNYLTAAVAFDAPPTPAGNAPQLRPGDEISLEYEQPDGSRLSTTIVLPLAR
jgi:hypothetical protein